MRAASRPEGGLGAAEPFPWNAAMSAGFCLLRLAPADFWRMTPREFARALAPFAAKTAEPIGRTALDALMRRFPDQARIEPGSSKEGRDGGG